MNFRPTHACNSTAHEQQSGGHGSKMSRHTTAHPDTGAACGRAVCVAMCHNSQGSSQYPSTLQTCAPVPQSSVCPR